MKKMTDKEFYKNIKKEKRAFLGVEKEFEDIEEVEDVE